MTQLSPHFALSEFVLSQTASRLGIDNTPPQEVLDNLRRTAMGLERVRQLLNSNAIRISSGYRCKALNTAVKGSPSSQHMTGQAVDFTCATYGPPDYLVRVIKDSGIDYDQLIAEFGSGGWVHISFNDNPRRQVLIVDSKGTRAFK